MLSKFSRVGRNFRCALLVPRMVNKPLIRILNIGEMVPRDQYTMPFPERLKLGNMLKVHWEVWPLVISIGIAVLFVFLYIVWAVKTKVDFVFPSHDNKTCHSRTMNLRHPTIHKIITITQKYEPWPEMQDVLDKMKEAEERVLMRAKLCSLVN